MGEPFPQKGSPKKKRYFVNSPLFAEISQTERSRGLGFALAAHAYDDEDEDGNEVGDHLVEGLGAFDVGCAEELGKEVVEPVEETEEVGAQMALRGFHVVKMTSATASQPRAST